MRSEVQALRDWLGTVSDLSGAAELAAWDQQTKMPQNGAAARADVLSTLASLTHELVGFIFNAFDIKVERMVVNELRSNTYFARLILAARNEVHQKVIEIDARPSDCLVLTLQAKAPIFVSQEVWDETEDRTEELEKIRQALREKKGPKQGPIFGEDD